MTSANATRDRGTSRVVDVQGPVHYLEAGHGPKTLVLVHGLGGSHANWLAVLDGFAKDHRVLVPDLVGHGRTPASGRNSKIATNVATLERFLEKVARRPVVLVGNSMGGLVVARLAARRPDLVERLVLVNPALPTDPGTRRDPMVVRLFALWSTPFVGAWLMRTRARKVGHERIVKDMLRLCSHDAKRIPAFAVEAMVDLARERAAMPWAETAFLEAARDVTIAILRRNAARKTLDAIRAPTLLVHGDRDRLVPHALGHQVRQKRPDWELRVLENAGHIPQLEIPDTFTRTINDWLTAVSDRAQPHSAPHAPAAR